LSITVVDHRCRSPLSITVCRSSRPIPDPQTCHLDFSSPGVVSREHLIKPDDRGRYRESIPFPSAATFPFDADLPRAATFRFEAPTFLARPRSSGIQRG